MKILAGALTADSGEIFIDGERAAIADPNDARRYGIETIYQELALCGNLDAPSNLFMGREANRLGFLSEKYMLQETKRVLESLKINLRSLTTRVDNLSGGQRQSIAIGRAVYFQAKILIMDEPTAALGMEESELVVRLIGELKAKGIGILFISHDIHDVYRFNRQDYRPERRQTRPYLRHDGSLAGRDRADDHFRQATRFGQLDRCRGDTAGAAHCLATPAGSKTIH